MPRPGYKFKDMQARCDCLTEEDTLLICERLSNWLDASKKNIWFEKFFVDDLSVTRTHFYDLVKRWKSTKIAFEAIKEKQEAKLVSDASYKEADGNFIKFLLVNRWKERYQDKNHTELSGDSSNPLAIALRAVDGKTKSLVDECEEEKCSDEQEETGACQGG